MNLNQIQNIYFIGIGGIGMSALARYFVALGKNVAGYDKTPTQLTQELEALGMAIHFNDSVDAIDAPFLNKENTLVVITPAIPKDHSEWNFFQNNGFIHQFCFQRFRLPFKGHENLSAVGNLHCQKPVDQSIGFLILFQTDLCFGERLHNAKIFRVRLQRLGK